GRVELLGRAGNGFRDDSMSHSHQQPGAGLPPPEPCGPPRPSSDAPGEHAESTRESHAASSNCDPTAELKQGLEATRLPPKLKEQILAELPPLEERKRMYRELQQSGGLSSEEFFASVGLPKGDGQP